MGKTPWPEAPWRVDGEANSHVFEDCIMAGETCVAFSDEPVSSLLAEMAEALADFVAMGEQYGWDKATTGRDILMRNARAVLAKAKGD